MRVPKALLISTFLQRLGLGLYLFSMFARYFLGLPLPMNLISLAALVCLGIGGLASAFHLGRPTRFFNAFSNFHSHLTQEAALTPFLGLALLVCGADGFVIQLGSGAPAVQWLTFILATAFLCSTGLVYQLGSRPAWNTPLVLIIFLATAAQIGSSTTMAAGILLLKETTVGMAVTTCMAAIICIVFQYLYLQRLKGLGYGVAVDVMDPAYRATFLLWLTFGVCAYLVGLACFIFTGKVIFLYLSVLCSLVGILAWTVLFFKVGLKVKMFPMYPVDLNVYM